MSRADADALYEMLSKGIVLVGGDQEFSIDLASEVPVFVALVFDVAGYGPHTGSIYAIQNRYHARSPDAALQPAFEIHEEWMREHQKDHLKDLYRDAIKKFANESLKGANLREKAWEQADEYFRENMNGSGYRLTGQELRAVIQRLDKRQRERVEKYIDFTDSSGKLNVKLKARRG